MQSDPQQVPSCHSCGGAGEVATDFGLADCPDCGGAGYLPEKRALVEWRTRDIERALGAGIRPANADVRWLISELRAARRGLGEVVALAHDIDDTSGIAMKIRLVAGRVLDG